MEQVDVLIITALQEELDAVLNLKDGGKPAWGKPDKTPDNFLYYTTDFTLQDGRKIVVRATTQWRMGTTVAAGTAARMLSFTKPRIACMVGICAGWREKDIEFGDVIVPERAFFYDIGKIREGNLNPENLVYDVNPNLIQWIKDFDSGNPDWASAIKSIRPTSIKYQKEWVLFQLWRRKEDGSSVWPSADSEILEAREQCPDWQSIISYLRKVKFIEDTNPLKITSEGIKFVENLRTNLQIEANKGRSYPKSWIGALATGNSVIEDSSIFDRLSTRERKVLGLETEAAAFLQEVQSTYPGLPSFVVKGVCDYADTEKGDSFHKYAAEASAQYMYYLLKHIIPFLDESPTPNGFNNTVSESIVDILKKLEQMKGLPDSIDELKGLLAQVFTNVEPSIPPIQLPPADKPPLRPKIFARRIDQVNRIKGILSDAIWLNIAGTSGIGKTHFAGEIAEDFGFEKVLWISMRVSNFNDLAHVLELHLLREAASNDTNEIKKDFFAGQYQFSELVQKSVNNKNKKSLIIIDELPDLIINQQFYEKIVELAKSLITLECKLITTSQRSLPSAAFLLNEGLTVIEEKVQVLNENNIRDLLVELGAPQSQNQTLIPLILTSTRGHPFFVSAIISFLNEQNWVVDEQVALSVITGEPLEEINFEIKRKLISLLPSERLRELLYRLTLVNIPFSNTIILDIGEVEIAINKPQELFLELTGPWINKLPSKLFEVSPLIKNIGKDILEIDTYKRTHLVIANYLVKQKVLDEIKILHIFTHFLKSEGWIQLGAFMINLSFNITKPFQANSLSFITKFYTEDWPSNIPTGIKIVFRSLQIMLLGMTERDAQKEIAEMEQLYNGFYASDAELALSLLVVLSQMQLIKPWNKALSPSFIAKKTLQNLKRMKILAAQPGLEDISPILLNSNIAANIWMSIQRINSRDEIREILMVLKEMNENERRSALSDEILYEAPMTFVDNCWGIELNKIKAEQDWQGVLVLLDEVNEIAQLPGGEKLMPLVLRAKAIVLGENLDRLEDAINLLKPLLIDNDNEEQFIYKFTIGTLYYDKGEFLTALSYFNESLSIKTKYIITSISCAKLASAAAGKMANWNDMRRYAITTLKLINGMAKQRSQQWQDNG